MILSTDLVHCIALQVRSVLFVWTLNINFIAFLVCEKQMYNAASSKSNRLDLLLLSPDPS
jgi:hypothetical protein